MICIEKAGFRPSVLRLSGQLLDEPLLRTYFDVNNIKQKKPVKEHQKTMPSKFSLVVLIVALYVTVIRCFIVWGEEFGGKNLQNSVLHL